MLEWKKEKGASDYQITAKIVGVVLFIWAAMQIYSCMGEALQNRRDRNKNNNEEVSETEE